MMSRITMCSVFLILKALRIHVECSAPSRLTRLTYYPDPVPWTRAREVCKEIGGHLPRLHTAAQSSTINEALQAHTSLKLSSDDRYWIGLELTYAWVGEEGSLGNWTGGNADVASPTMCADTCVSSNLSGLWGIEQCDHKNAVVCERQSNDSCEFKVYYESVLLKTDSSALNLYVAAQNVTDSECRELCLQLPAGCDECWVWVQVGSNCVLYKSCSPNMPDIPEPPIGFPSSVEAFYFKTCISVSTNRTSIAVEDSLTTTVSPNSTVPTSHLNTSTQQIATTPLVAETTESTNKRFSLTQEGGSTGTVQYKCEPITSEPISDDNDSLAGTTVGMDSSTNPRTTLARTSPFPELSFEDTGAIEDSTSTSCVCPVPVRVNTGPPTSTEPPRGTNKPSRDDVSKLMDSLQLNFTKTSAYRRRHTSAPDDRPSAKSVGYVGVALLCVFVGIILCFDLKFAVYKFISFL